MINSSVLCCNIMCVLFEIQKHVRGRSHNLHNGFSEYALSGVALGLQPPKGHNNFSAHQSFSSKHDAFFSSKENFKEHMCPGNPSNLILFETAHVFNRFPFWGHCVLDRPCKPSMSNRSRIFKLFLISHINCMLPRTK